jgi:hypothetical protein
VAENLRSTVIIRRENYVGNDEKWVFDKFHAVTKMRKTLKNPFSLFFFLAYNVSNITM